MDQIRLRYDEVEWCKVIWFSQAVPRFAFITWLAVKDRLSTGTRMRQWGCVQVCLFCGERDESRDHLFFACSFSYLVWLDVAGGLLHSEPDPDWNGTLLCLCVQQNEGHCYIFLRLAFQATIYCLWRERNDRRHNKRFCTHTQVSKTIEKLIRNPISSLRYYDSKKL